MHTVFALLCFVVVIHWLIFPYPSGLLHWHCGNLTIAPVPAKQPWWIWINTSCEFVMNDCITTTKQSTTKPCAYFLGYTVPLGQERLVRIYGIGGRYILRSMHVRCMCLAQANGQPQALCLNTICLYSEWHLSTGNGFLIYVLCLPFLKCMKCTQTLDFVTIAFDCIIMALIVLSTITFTINIRGLSLQTWFRYDTLSPWLYVSFALIYRCWNRIDTLH